MIAHFYDNMKNPEGWFSFKNFYEKMAKELPNNFKIIEIGCFFGKSCSYLAVELANLGKTGDFYVVDTFKGSNEAGHKRIMSRYGVNDFYNLFTENLDEGGIRNLVIPIKSTSIAASKLFNDRYFDMVCIDGDHSYDAVKQDIRHWYDKIKIGGTLGGDDIKWGTVHKAVTESLDNVNIEGNAWWTKILE